MNQCTLDQPLYGAIRLLKQMIEVFEPKPSPDQNKSWRNALSLLLGTSNCYCKGCREISLKYYMIPGTEGGLSKEAVRILNTIDAGDQGAAEHDALIQFRDRLKHAMRVI